MPLTLSIDNLDRLPDGGPLTYTMRGQSHIEIGRDSHLDWSLPDPERFISGKHCEINRRGDEYLLVDVSTNGTFVNDSPLRVQSPYRLKSGDRLQIGEYLISVALTLDDDASVSSRLPEPAPAIDRPASNESMWDVDGDIAPPADPKAFRPLPRTAPVYSDFLFHAADVPRVAEPAQFSPHAANDSATSAAPPRESPVRVPEPRRPKIEDIGWDDAVPTGSAPSAWRNASPAAPTPEEEIQPEPRRASEPAPLPRSSPRRASDSGEGALLEIFSRAAGLRDDFFSGRDDGEVAALLGRTMRIVADEMQQLLQARAQAKRLARSAHHTMVEARENNPLKFSATPEDALRIMFGPPTSSYLDAEHALSGGFHDLKRHQAQSYSAMQQAVTRMVADLDPARIEGALPALGGVAALLTSRNAQLWEAYVASWKAQSNGNTEDLIQRFMFLFGKYYDSSG